MAFFKFRKGADAPQPAPPESVEAMRRRARYRLTGAVVLVLAGVIGFPLLFDTQPRPMAVDIPIEIPDRNKVKPLGAPASTSAAPASKAEPAVAATPSTPASAPVPAASSAAVTAARREPVPSPRADERAEARPDANVEGKADAKAESKGDAKAENKPESKADAKAAKVSPRAEQEASKAKALLEGKPAEAAAAASAPAGEARYVVQVGAFADAAKAQDTRQKVERTGLKTYTHVADTKEGKRTRVRVGPFATRSEADKAAARIKGLDLPASVLTL